MSLFSSESGAVTVDWVVLTAGLVGLGLATLSVVSTGTQDVADDVEQQLSRSIVTGYSNFGDDAPRSWEELLATGISEAGAQHFYDHGMTLGDDTLIRMAGIYGLAQDETTRLRSEAYNLALYERGLLGDDFDPTYYDGSSDYTNYGVLFQHTSWQARVPDSHWGQDALDYAEGTYGAQLTHIGISNADYPALLQTLGDGKLLGDRNNLEAWVNNSSFDPAQLNAIIADFDAEIAARGL